MATTAIFGLRGKRVLEDTSSHGPALASAHGRLFIAWKGSGNQNLNLMFSEDGGYTFKGKRILKELSDSSPALASLGDRLFIAWRGVDNEQLNLAEVSFFADTSGGFEIEGLTGKHTLSETSSDAPALVGNGNAAAGLLTLAWKGSGNDFLNLITTQDKGAHFVRKVTIQETSHVSPALAGLLIAWRGEGDETINAGSSGPYIIGAPIPFPHPPNKVTMRGASSSDSPALALHHGRYYIAWKGSGNDNLTLLHYTELVGITDGSTYISSETSPSRPALASHQGGLFLAWRGVGNEQLNVAEVVLQSWLGIGGFFPSRARVAAVSRNPNQLDLFVVGNDGRVYTSWWSAGSDWSGI